MCSSCAQQPPSQLTLSEQEDPEASALFMGVLGVLLLHAIVGGALTGQYGVAIWCALMAWIPACLIAGGTCDHFKKAQAT